MNIFMAMTNPIAHAASAITNNNGMILLMRVFYTREINCTTVES